MQMKTMYRRLWIAFFTTIAVGSAGAQSNADGLQLLGDFIRTVQTGRAQFTQTVTSPGARWADRTHTRLQRCL